MYEDFLGQEDFMIDPEDLDVESTEPFETGIVPDIFASGENQDIFSTLVR